MERDFSLRRVVTMLEKKDALPGAKSQPAALDRDRYLRRLISTRCFGTGAGLTGPACVYSGHQPSGSPKTIQRVISCTRAYSMVSSG